MGNPSYLAIGLSQHPSQHHGDDDDDPDADGDGAPVFCCSLWSSTCRIIVMITMIMLMIMMIMMMIMKRLNNFNNIVQDTFRC